MYMTVVSTNWRLISPLKSHISLSLTRNCTVLKEKETAETIWNDWSTPPSSISLSRSHHCWLTASLLLLIFFSDLPQHGPSSLSLIQYSWNLLLSTPELQSSSFRASNPLRMGPDPNRLLVPPPTALQIPPSPPERGTGCCLQQSSRSRGHLAESPFLRVSALRPFLTLRFCYPTWRSVRLRSMVDF